MKYLTRKKKDLEKLKVGNFYKLIWLEDNTVSVIVLQCTKEYNKIDNRLEFITIMVSENNLLRNTKIGETRYWGSFPNDNSYFIDLEDESEN
jgi:hypothetical protein